MKKYTFSFGKAMCTVLNDTKIPYDADTLWTNAPKHELENELRNYQDDVLSKGSKQQVFLPVNLLFVQTEHNHILIDTGMGHCASYFNQPADLHDRLLKEGINLKDIDTVILTHGHIEHIGGLIREDGHPFYPNAKIVMSKDEYRLWMAKDPHLDCFLKTTRDTANSMAKLIRRQLKKIDSSRFHLVEGEREILHGVRVLPSPGHTPGSMVIEISSGGETLLCIGDTFLHPIHAVRPEWVPLYDHSFQKAIKQRKVMLERYTDQNNIIYASHFPFPGIGYFKKGAVDNQVRWIPRSVENRRVTVNTTTNGINTPCSVEQLQQTGVHVGLYK